jgi:hypothetical protein
MHVQYARCSMHVDVRSSMRRKKPIPVRSTATATVYLEGSGAGLNHIHRLYVEYRLPSTGGSAIYQHVSLCCFLGPRCRRPHVQRPGRPRRAPSCSLPALRNAPGDTECCWLGACSENWIIPILSDAIKDQIHKVSRITYHQELMHRSAGKWKEPWMQYSPVAYSRGVSLSPNKHCSLF